MKRDFSMIFGHLGEGERQLASHLSRDETTLAPRDARLARQHYELVLGVTRKAHKELRGALDRGLPMRANYPSGGLPVNVELPHARMARLINAFAWANRSLFNAAGAVCEAEDIEDGVDDEIVFEVPL